MAGNFETPGNRLSAELKTIDRDLRERHLMMALNRLDSLISSDTQFRQLAPTAARLRETYTLLANYAMAGLPDPSRKEMLDRLTRDIRTAATTLRRMSLSVDNPKLYYSTLRFETTRHDNDLATLAASYLKLASQNALAMFGAPDTSGSDLRRRLEEAERRWFRVVWTAFPLDREKIEAIRSLMQNEVAAAPVKAMTLGALLLGALEFYDPERIELLLDTASDPTDSAGSMRATLYTAIAMAMAPTETLTPHLRARFEALAENQQWRDNLSAVFTQLLRARDTERISRKINDEILPSMKNIGKDFSDIARKIDPDDPESIEEMPEWQELIENSDFAAKMREMNEIQQEGGDVMMTTFGQLKNFPFFNEISNWFIPFDPSRSEIAAAMEEFGPMADALLSNPMICDNDHYSVALALANMPQSQRNMLTRQMQANADQLAEMQAAALDRPEAGREALAANQVRSLYRFFKLFNRREEFADPFDTPLNMLRAEAFRPALDRSSLSRQAADFFMAHGYWEEALPLLLESESAMAAGEEASTYFRIGSALAATGDYSRALDYFEKSELFDSSETNEDLMLKMAGALRRLGNHRRAASYFRKVSARRGGDDRIDLFTASSLASSGNWEEAAALLYRIDYNLGLKPPSIRELAECEFRLGHYDKSRATTGRLPRLQATDRARLAAIAIATGEYPAAIKALTDRPADTRAAVAILTDPDGLLANLGADPDIVNIIIDSALSESL